MFEKIGMDTGISYYRTLGFLCFGFCREEAWVNVFVFVGGLGFFRCTF